MKYYKKNAAIILIILIVLIAGVAYWITRNITTVPAMPSAKVTIDSNSANYGRFIDNTDNWYFSTRDANVKKIIEIHLSNSHGFTDPTDAQKYGSYVVYYYDKNSFIVGEKTDPLSDTPTAYVMRDIKNGQKIGDCIIFREAGLYKSEDALISVSFVDEGVVVKQGVCFYELGAERFTFIDMTPQLGETETLFTDPAGRDLNAVTKNVDTQKKTLTVDVFDKGSRNASGAYVYKRSIEISY